MFIFSHVSADRSSGTVEVGTEASQRPSSEAAAKDELDRYSEEFAALIEQHPPVPNGTPSDWLRRLPDEVFQYYQHGISTFGQEAESTDQRRGRLYLLHTSLVFMWMKWGRQQVRERFPDHAKKGTRRVGRLATLEYYRRGDILIDYEVEDWLHQPVEEWTATVHAAGVSPDAVLDTSLREAVQENDEVTMSVAQLSHLLEEGAIPSRHELSLG